jgi:hypothetical protein
MPEEPDVTATATVVAAGAVTVVDAGTERDGAPSLADGAEAAPPLVPHPCVVNAITIKKHTARP